MARTETFTDAAEALGRCDDLFSGDPIGCNMVAASIRPPDPVELIRASTGNRTVGAAIRWGEGYTLSSVTDAAGEALADALPVDRRLEVFGPAGPTAAVAGRWSQRCDGSFQPIELMRVYRLGALRPPVGVDGQMATADDEHLDLGAEWSIAFATEIGHEPSTLAATRAQLARATHQGRLFTWVVRGEPVAQLLVSVERFGVVRIGGVYTPPGRRGHGIASAMTAAVSAHHLARPDVDTVTLNTQAANAATNRLYRRLGFEAHHEIVTIELDPRPSAA